MKNKQTKKIFPFFNYQGNKYEIRPTRFLLLKWEDASHEINLTQEERFLTLQQERLTQTTRDLAQKLKELKEAFFADMTNEKARAQYKACKEEYTEAYDELAKFEIENSVTQRMTKATLDALERIAIWGIAEQYFGYDESHKEIERVKAAEKVWCGWVDTITPNVASEWLGEMASILFIEEDEVEENSFLSQMRERRKNQTTKEFLAKK